MGEELPCLFDEPHYGARPKKEGVRFNPYLTPSFFKESCDSAQAQCQGSRLMRPLSGRNNSDLIPFALAFALVLVHLFSLARRIMFHNIRMVMVRSICIHFQKNRFSHFDADPYGKRCGYSPTAT